jgi:hypothetical protein
VFPSQAICGEGRVGGGFFVFIWKWDNKIFSLFYGIGEREERGWCDGRVYILRSVYLEVLGVWVDKRLEVFFYLCGRIIGVEGLEAYPVFEPSLCLGGFLRFFVCEAGQVRLLVFGSVQVGEGFSCLCL